MHHIDGFFFAGFEGTTGRNRRGAFIDQVVATGHERHLDQDYAAIRAAGLSAARESVRWPLVDRGERYDFRSLDPVLDAARRHGVTLLLDLFHFGYPSDAHPLDPGFPERFARYCDAVVRHVCRRVPPPHWFAPVNEPSYFAWAGGEVGCFAPHLRGRGPELKTALVRAAIAGAQAVLAACPEARLLSIDPLCSVVPRDRTPGARRAAEAFNTTAVFEAWDAIAGRSRPQLGGHPRLLGTVGVNYYWTNQWELDGRPGPLAGDDPRRLPLGQLLRRVWERYHVPLIVTETAGCGDGRAAWIEELADECAGLLEDGVPLGGACLYPAVSMPEWHEPSTWAPLGLWDVDVDPAAGLARIPHRPALDALAAARDVLETRVRRTA